MSHHDKKLENKVIAPDMIIAIKEYINLYKKESKIIH